MQILDRQALASDTARSRTFDKSHLAIQVGIGAYVFLSAIFLLFGQYNNDEGWYLYASKMIMQGSLPYRDLAFPQMPLLPYLYGVIQIVQPSLLLGRLTSIIVSIAALGMSIAIARRYGGTRAAGIAALLLAAFTFGIYFDSIVKTYAFVSFCFVATLFVLSSDFRDRWKYPLATLLVMAAVLTRVTAVLYAVPILIYVLRAAKGWARAGVLAVAAGAGLVAAYFILPDLDVAHWNIFASHLNNWGDASLLDKLRVILAERVPAAVQTFGPLLVLGVIAAVIVLLSRRLALWRRNPSPLVAATIGLALFAAAHLVNGRWDTEYLVPGAVALIPIIAIGLARASSFKERRAPYLVGGAVLAVVVLLPLNDGLQHLSLPDGRPPLAQISVAGSFVQANTGPDDVVMVLENTGILVEANRGGLPGMTLAQFSLQDVDDERAEQLHVVNYNLVARAIDNGTARAVVLSDYDWESLTRLSPGDADNLRSSLDRNYSPALVIPNFGQFSHTLTVYLRR